MKSITGNASKLFQAALVLAALAVPVVASAAPAALPPVAFPATGGDSVTGGGEWSIITDDVTCETQIYRLNYLTMDWVFSETEAPILGTTCTAGEFGQSSSLSGNVIVIGIPGWDGLFAPDTNNLGGIALVEFGGAAWARVTGLNSALGFVQVASPITQNGSLFGASVSVSRSPTNPDQYLIVVGSPMYDSAGLTDNGQVYVYRFNAATNALTYITGVAGSFNQGNLGVAVTADYPFFLAGEPGADPGGNANAGAARLYEAQDLVGGDGLLDSVVLDETLVAGLAGAGLGVEVSLSAEFAQVSGMVDAFAWDNTGDSANRTYLLRNVAFASDGGDVSQSAGIAAFGFNGLGQEGANLYRDPITDAVPADSVSVDVNAAFGGDLLGDIGIDIRLVRESLWFANPAEDRALLYQFPAGFGMHHLAVGAVPPYNFYQRSLPCDAAGRMVGEVFADIPGGNAANGGTGFVVYRYDDTRVSSTNPYIGPLSDAYAFTAADLNYSLWLAVAQDGYVEVSACNDFTTADFAVPPSGGGLDGVLPARVKAQKVISLPDPDPDDEFGRVMVNNPFPREARLADILYHDAVGPKALADAEQDVEISATFYVYDVNSNDLPGQYYRAITAAGTPPFADRVQGFEGFWVRVLENGVNSGAGTHALLMPLTE